MALRGAALALRQAAPLALLLLRALRGEISTTPYTPQQRFRRLHCSL